VSMMEIYKPTQGRNTRMVTFVSVIGIVIIGAYVLSEKLVGTNIYIQFGIPTGIVIGVAVLMFWFVNRVKSADFLIATEGEMKKVSWSSRKEVIGSTKVVIVTAFILASLLFTTDLLFTFLFHKFGIMSGS